MKTALHLLVLLIALGSTAVASSTANANSNRALAHSVKSVQHRGDISIVPGTTCFDVVRELGEPSRKLAANVWAYDRFSGGDAQSRNDDCSILLLTFQNDRVAQMQLINPSAQRVIAGRIEASKHPTMLIAENK